LAEYRQAWLDQELEALRQRNASTEEIQRYRRLGRNLVELSDGIAKMTQELEAAEQENRFWTASSIRRKRDEQISLAQRQAAELQDLFDPSAAGESSTPVGLLRSTDQETKRISEGFAKWRKLFEAKLREQAKAEAEGEQSPQEQAEPSDR
jgi:hypothetical protein